MALEAVGAISDELFQRRFRLSRLEFAHLLAKIHDDLLPAHPHMGERSSGSFIQPALKLYVTLRFLAGGSYLDIAPLYGIAEGSFYSVVHETLAAINLRLDNIQFPSDARNNPADMAELQRMEKRFRDICHSTFPGTVLAADGVVFRMRAPRAHEVDSSVISYYQR